MAEDGSFGPDSKHQAPSGKYSIFYESFILLSSESCIHHTLHHTRVENDSIFLAIFRFA
jgi:hypothetical protein